MAVALYISPPPFPFFPFSPFFYFLPARAPPPSPLENVTAAILFYAVSYLYEGTTGKLQKTCAHTVGRLTESVPSLQSLKK